MTSGAAIQLRKEFRELLPLWGGTVAVMLACWLLRFADAMPFEWLYGWAVRLGGGEQVIGVGAYAVGSVIVGASSIGQEYFHHTLHTLLIQPVSRRRLLLVKCGVLVPMLVSLSLLAVVAFGSGRLFDEAGAFDRVLMLGGLPLVSGLCLAPWLTMVCRSAMAGAVFSVVAPVPVLLSWVYLRLPLTLMWPVVGAIAVAGAVMLWRTFLRLEVTGSSTADISLPTFVRRAGGRARAGRMQHPLWLLLKKEARLQELTFVLTGIYVLVFAVVVGGRALIPPESVEPVLFVALFFQTGVVPILIGALASAEERRLGVTDWQTLLPFAAWKQWAIKVVFTLTLAFVLVMILPRILLESVAGIPELITSADPIPVLMLSIAALYVSSLCSSGLRAFLATVPVMVAAALGGAALVAIFSYATDPAVRFLAATLQSIVPLDRQDSYWWGTVVMARRGAFFWISVGFALLVLYAAFTNHRTADRGRRRVLKQVAWLATYVMAAWLVLTVANTMIAIAIQR